MNEALDRPGADPTELSAAVGPRWMTLAAWGLILFGALALLAVACSLLDRQIAAQEKAFTTEGGFTERLYRVRSQNRRRP